MSRLQLVLGLSIFMFACGDKKSDESIDGGVIDTLSPSPDAPPPPASDYCKLLHRACERQIECGVAVLNQRTTVESCYADLYCDATVSDLQTAGVAFQTDNIKSCITAMDAAACPTLDQPGLFRLKECALLFAGTRAEGEPCVNGAIAVCKEGLACMGPDRCGTCATATPPCIEGGCGAGKFCDGGDCLPIAHLGEDCHIGQGWENGCSEGSACQWDDAASTFVCKESLAVGAACGGSLDRYTCEQGAYCDLDNGQCSAPARKKGEECFAASYCEPGLYCTQANICADRIPMGGACVNFEYECAAGLDCVAAPGADCQNGYFDCPSGTDCCVISGKAQCVANDGECEMPVGICGPIDYDRQRPAVVATSILASGAPCGQLGEVCPLGSVCRSTQDADHKCQAPKQVGEACTFEDFMSETCDGICDVFGSQTCVKPGPPGAACSFETRTVTFECSSAVCEHMKCVASSTCE